MPKPDIGKIQANASKFLAKGNWVKALEAYEELEKLSKSDLRIPQKIAELYRRLNQTEKAVKKYHESAQKYLERGFLVQSIAVYKVILEIAPEDAAAKEALARLAEQRSEPVTKKKMPTKVDRRTAKEEEGRKEEERETLAPPADTPPPAKEAAVEEEADLGIPLDSAEEVPLERGAPTEDYGMIKGLEREGEEELELDSGKKEWAEGSGEEEPASTELELDIGIDLEETPLPPAEEKGQEASPEKTAKADTDALEIDPARLEVVPVEAEEKLPAVGPEHTPLFSDLKKEEFERVLELLQSRVVVAGTEIVHQHEEGDSLYIIARGEVEVTVEDEKGSRRQLAILGPSEFFGEIGYFHGRRRATVTALKKCLLLEISKSDLDQIADDFPRVKEILTAFYQERVLDNLLALSPLFSHLDTEERRRIAAAFVLKKFEPGQVIVAEGDPGDSMFLIKSGEVVVKTTHVEGTGEVELARLSGGDFFGEVSLVKNKPRTATIIVLTPTEVFELSRADFQQIADKHPEIGAALEHTIEQRVENTIQKMIAEMKK